MKKYYIFSGSDKHFVNQEIYAAINKIINRMSYIRRKADQCHATSKQRAKCQCDCSQCPAYSNQEQPLDYFWMIPGSHEPTLDEIVACSEILDAMQRIDPDGRRIGLLYLGGCRDADIARILGVSTGAFSRRKKKIQAHLVELLAAE